MKKLSLFLSVLICNVAVAQTTSISGYLIDKTTNEALQFANVQIFSLPDTTFLKGDVTKDDGSFKIEGIKAEKCLVRASFIGYNTVDKAVNVTKGQDNSVGRIYLKEDSKQLAEVSIQAEATPVVVRDDTVVFNADAFHVTEGAMVEDLVKKLPGAEISSDGKLTVGGKEVTKILIGGKEYFANDPQVTLKNLPANMVKDIKTYDKKSEQAELTGIDDDDEEFVLDFTVRKSMMDSWIGNIWGGIGHDINGPDDYRYDGHLDLNQFDDKGNMALIANLNNTNNTSSDLGDNSSGMGMGGMRGGMGGGMMMMGGMMGGFGGGFGGGGMMMMGFGGGITETQNVMANFEKEVSKSFLHGGNIQYSRTNTESEGKTATETFRGDDYSTVQKDTSTSTSIRNNLNASYRIKWAIDTMTTIIFRPNVRMSFTDYESEGESLSLGNLLADETVTNDTLTNGRKTVNTQTNENTTNSTSISYNASLQAVRKLNNYGRSIQLNLRINGSLSPSDRTSFSDTHFYQNDSTSIVDRETDGKSSNLTLMAELGYVEPIFEKNYLQFRYNFQTRSSDSYSYVYEDGSEVRTDDLSSEVENSYYNHRVEAIWQGRYDKLNYNLGVSLQPQISETHNILGANVGNDKKQTVFNWSPTMRLQYKFTKQHTIQLRYNGRSSAPDVQNLQEIISVTDPLNLQYGNPNLKPTFSNNISLNYNNFMRESGKSIMFNLSYNNTLNTVSNEITYNPLTGGQESHKINLNGNWSTNGFLTLSSPIGSKKLSITSTSMANYSENVSMSTATKLANGTTVGGGKITTATTTLQERLQLNYRCDAFDFSINGSVRYLKSGNDQKATTTSGLSSATLSNDRETFDYELGANTTINLPWKMTFATDFNWRIYSGYTDGYDRDLAIWNAQITKNFTQDNRCAVRVKVFDILQQQKSISRYVSSSSVIDSESNTLGSYVIVQFVYKINSMRKQAKQMGPGGFGPGGFGPGGFGPGGFGGPGMF
ncbi:MAG: TonB-dependent receptor [Salinivirgaceae bacterium]|nr:TonB-dependent receptor [Salinivirgaceae bacterium]